MTARSRAKFADYLTPKSKVEPLVFQAHSVSEKEDASSSVLLGEPSYGKGSGLKGVKVPTLEEILMSGHILGAFLDQ